MNTSGFPSGASMTAMDTSLSGRFRQLNAPDHFRPELNIPLRWRCSHKRPDVLALFDPSVNTGFGLRVTGESLDIAFHLDGRIARVLVEREVIDDEAAQEEALRSFL